MKGTLQHSGIWLDPYFKTEKVCLEGPIPYMCARAISSDLNVICVLQKYWFSFEKDTQMKPVHAHREFDV